MCSIEKNELSIHCKEIRSRLKILTVTILPQVVVTEGLDCNFMDRVYNRPEANKGITGTHTRLLVFNLTDYDKVLG